MKDLRLEIKVKNNILYRKIFERFDSVRAFCKNYGLADTDVGKVLSFKESVIRENKRGGIKIIEGTGGKYYWSKLATRLSDIFLISEEDLFPEHFREIRNSFYAFELESSKILPFYEQPPTPLELLEKNELNEFLTENLKTLTAREQRILEYRYGINSSNGVGETLKNTGKIMNITTERTRQIETRALKKLKKSLRLNKLRHYL